jgi:hypothetical protein
MNPPLDAPNTTAVSIPRLSGREAYRPASYSGVDGKISYMLGYSDLGNFSRSFKKTSGLSPQEFRKKHPS